MRMIKKISISYQKRSLVRGLKPNATDSKSVELGFMSFELTSTINLKNNTTTKKPDKTI